MPIPISEIKDGLLTVRQASADGRFFIGLEGELDLSNAKTVEAPLLDAIAADEDLIIDLGKLEFIDSTGIALLVMAMQEKKSGLGFLPSESAEVQRLLYLTGLDQRMPLAITEEKSMTELRFPDEDLPTVLPAA